MREVMVDTDILSFYMKGDKNVINHFAKYLNSYNNINLSIISYYEIISGLKFKDAQRQLQIFELFCQENTILPFTTRSARIAGDLYKDSRNKGIPVDDIDLLIASIALENSLTLVTNNTRHFENIEDLDLENWKASV